MPTDVSLLETLVSGVLVVVVVGLSLWRKLGLEIPVIWATIRATVQLLLVGLLFTAIFESSLASLWAWTWVALMTIVAGLTVGRRAPSVPGLMGIGLAAMAATLAIVLFVVFGLGILDPEPVAVIVISGITIGNTMPTVVQAATRSAQQLADEVGQIEAMLSLGFNASGATQRIASDVTKLALIPQIERTKAVGIIALPGAMTGLLLAGTDPIDAVLIQLVVMLLVLGSVAVSVVIVTLAVTRRSLTPDLRVADWVTNRLRDQ